MTPKQQQTRPLVVTAGPVGVLVDARAWSVVEENIGRRRRRRKVWRRRRGSKLTQ